MNSKKYLEESAKTVNDGFFVNDIFTQRILHAVMGLSGESGELLDSLKKTIFYGKELDLENIEEELGDILFYIAILLRELNLSFEELFDQNIAKLRTRYPKGKFSLEDSNKRDYNAEQKARKAVKIT